MDVRTRIRSAFDPSPFLDAHINESLAYALGSRGELVRSVDVRVADVNGPRRSAADKVTTIELAVRPFGSVVVRGAAPDVYESVRSAALKARAALTRHAHKLAKKGRRRGRATP